MAKKLNRSAVQAQGRNPFVMTTPTTMRRTYSADPIDRWDVLQHDKQALAVLHDTGALSTEALARYMGTIDGLIALCLSSALPRRMQGAA